VIEKSLPFRLGKRLPAPCSPRLDFPLIAPDDPLILVHSALLFRCHGSRSGRHMNSYTASLNNQLGDICINRLGAAELTAPTLFQDEFPVGLVAISGPVSRRVA
jgi:hypothetical protein